MDHGPEIYCPNIPEVNHDPQGHPLEVAPNHGLEFLCHDYYSGNLNGGIALGGAIGGGLGGALSRKSKNQEVTTTQPPAATATSMPSVGPLNKADTVLTNTSIAATTCPSGDRWVFLQDTNGTIRAAQYSSPTSSWSVTRIQPNQSPPKRNTSLSASCVIIPPDLASNDLIPGLSPGLYISLIYLDASDALQQVVYSEGSWTQAWNLFAPIPPANNTKLSMSTTIVTPQNSAIVSFNSTQKPNFTSVAVYQAANGTFIMIDLSPLDMPTNPNLFSLFEGMNYSSANMDAVLGVNLACIHHEQAPTIGSQLFTQCVLASFGQSWIYNQSSISQGEQFKMGDGEAYSYWNNSITDVTIVLLSDGNLATINLLHSNTINSEIEPIGLTSESNSASWSTTIPYDHISATSLSGNSTTFYVYYQANGTVLGEIEFDLNGGGWGTQPAFIRIS
ncbi:hypothetical protein MMC27_007873 [Xylographa pallens]|nr:hypothetical protein [Xylographa pallens]